MSRSSGPLRAIQGRNTSTNGNALISQSGTREAGSAQDALLIVGAANSSATATLTLTNASMGQATTVTIPDPGQATASFMLSGTVAGTATEASNAATLNGAKGVLTSSALTTAGGSTYTITLTNSSIKTTSVVLVSNMGGTNTVHNVSLSATAAAGSSVITISNNTTATALNGTIILGFQVL